jgi:hypothetical protein
MIAAVIRASTKLSINIWGFDTLEEIVADEI